MILATSNPNRDAEFSQINDWIFKRAAGVVTVDIFKVTWENYQLVQRLCNTIVNSRNFKQCNASKTAQMSCLI